ncbi:hypothetical protein HG537_0F00730 [Torulaspora globosa]|uniref:Protein YTP1-like C-terminal domain-containing protein n=1 Tax=Torulaspora globosa TaxID=48254 RepID=A0A7H9HXZ2_9SACH|nr:hypothetical protein HG537_0F00730 [Torulaspora sp. CBS 2947]
MRLKVPVVLVALISVCWAHGDMEMDMSGGDDEMTSMMKSNETVVPVPHEPKHLHGLPILQRPGLTAAEKLYWTEYNTTTFFNTELGNRAALKYHAGSLLVSAVFVYPVCLALNSIGSSWFLPVLFVNAVLSLSSLLALSVFSASFPYEWYPKNAYRATSWILLVLVVVHFVTALICQASRWFIGSDAEIEHNFFIPLEYYNEEGSSTPQTNNEESQLENDHTESAQRADVGQKDSFDLENRSFSGTFKSMSSVKRDSLLNKVFSNGLIQCFARKFGNFASLVFNVLNYPLLLYYFVDVTMGIAVGNLLGKGVRIFNLLAHWIKGGVFICLGLVSLARYCGFGRKNGWAWNKVIITKKQFAQENPTWIRRMLTPRGMITMEGIESFLIFFYGSTNIFLEHLAGAGGPWTAKDLQHVSIAFMYIGSGLCGLLSEIKLNDWKFNHALQHSEDIAEEDVYAGSPGYSPNPFPTFTIFWTGILMSQHAQASETSTTIHVQWGYLLSYGSFFRLLTFVLLFLVPNKNYEPSKPFTELITSFCLLCGGLIFMESTDQVIEAMEYRGFTPMFSFNISVGFITLVMAWEMSLFLWKNWLQKRQHQIN